jgi:lysine biosynthesis protein LysW
MTHVSKIAQAHCPECGTLLRFRRRLEPGSYLICPHCDRELEVSGVTPLELSLAFDDLSAAGDADEPLPPPTARMGGQTTEP